jgi:hypothetical protein
MEWYSSANSAQYNSAAYSYAPPTTASAYSNSFEDEPPLLEGGCFLDVDVGWWPLLVCMRLACLSPSSPNSRRASKQLTKSPHLPSTPHPPPTPPPKELGIDIGAILRSTRAILLHQMRSPALDSLDFGGALVFLLALGGLHLLVGFGGGGWG